MKNIALHISWRILCLENREFSNLRCLMNTLHNYVRACAPCFGQLNINIDSPILRKYNYHYNNKYEDMLNDMGPKRSSTKEPKGQRARK